MKLALIIFVCSGAALAAFKLTSRERSARRPGRRLAGRSSQLQGDPVALGTNVSQADSSSDWAGAILSRSTATWAAVTGTFILPTPKVPSGSTTGYASVWIGMDGYTCDSAILQTGVDFNVDGDQVSYNAWYEWYPDYAYDFSGISLTAGDSITATVEATSKTGGTVTIINNSKGTTVSHAFTGQPALCEYDAEWIIEDFDTSSLVPGVDFGTITFTDAYATELNGTKVYPFGATIVEIEQSGKVLTSCSASSTAVTCSYV